MKTGECIIFHTLAASQNTALIAHILSIVNILLSYCQQKDSPLSLLSLSMHFQAFVFLLSARSQKTAIIPSALSAHSRKIVIIPSSLSAHSQKTVIIPSALSANSQKTVIIPSALFRAFSTEPEICHLSL
jgi:hypothetical protein